jgi:hypothetical protein
MRSRARIPSRPDCRPSTSGQSSRLKVWRGKDRPRAMFSSQAEAIAVPRPEAMSGKPGGRRQVPSSRPAPSVPRPVASKNGRCISRDLSRFHSRRRGFPGADRSQQPHTSPKSQRGKNLSRAADRKQRSLTSPKCQRGRNQSRSSYGPQRPDTSPERQRERNAFPWFARSLRRRLRSHRYR